MNKVRPQSRSPALPHPPQSRTDLPFFFLARIAGKSKTSKSRRQGERRNTEPELGVRDPKSCWWLGSGPVLRLGGCVGGQSAERVAWYPERKEGEGSSSRAEATRGVDGSEVG